MTQRIADVGVTTHAAVSARKPDDFGNAGANWARDGWMVPVHWTDASSTVRPKALLNDLRPHLP